MYKYTPGFHAPKGINANEAGNALEQIRTKHNLLTAELVVDESKDANHALHNAFEWDNAIAGNEYRKHQARTLIRSIVIIYEDTKVEHRSYVLTTVDSDDAPLKQYMPTTFVMGNDHYRKRAIGMLIDGIDRAMSGVTELINLIPSDSPDTRIINKIANSVQRLKRDADKI
jgi:hypothetical protein